MRLLARLIRLLSRPRPLVTRLTRLHAALIRASGGRLRRSRLLAGGQPVMSLTTIGRRSGRLRSTTVAYFRDGDALVTTAANLGNERDPAWALNLQANPQATVCVDGRTLAIRARRARGEERERLWARWAALQAPAAAMQEIAGREIPVFVLEPVEAAAPTPAAPQPAGSPPPR